MTNHRMWLVWGLLLGLGVCQQAWADPTPDSRSESSPQRAGETPALAPDVQALARKIDEYIAARWKADGVVPAAPAADPEFLRRPYLDLIGRIPTAAEARLFLEDRSADKRARLIDRLLESPGHVNHSVNTLRSLFLPEADASFEARFLVPGFERWLRKQVQEDTPWDRMAREILTVTFSGDRRPVLDPTGTQGDPQPTAYYFAKEGKPENLASATARNFLGIRLECAQCHNHPTAKWRREQFWSYAAFFAGLQRQGADNAFAAIREVGDRRELAIPSTEQVVQASFLDGAEPQWKPRTSPRVTLAEWVTAPDNPYFARAAANRMWAHFFGVGLVDPVDDLDPDNPASHPELLDELAKQLVQHRYDLKFLMRAITTSQTYQLSSISNSPQPSDIRLFARMPVRGLTPEQVFDSVAVAVGLSPAAPQSNPRLALVNTTPRGEFLSRFGNQGDNRTEVQTSILQALSLMNGKLISDATSLEKSETLAAVADAPFMDDAQKVETLFLATLSRLPTDPEKTRLVKYVRSGGPSKDSKKALADVFWALLNTGEFLLYH